MLPGEGGHGRESLLMEVAEKTAVWRGFTALSGILFFFMAERLLSVLTSRKKAKKTAKGTEEEIPEPMLYSEGRVGQKLSQYRKNSHFELGQKEMMHSNISCLLFDKFTYCIKMNERNFAYVNILKYK